jgi:hypothetical protein
MQNMRLTSTTATASVLALALAASACNDGLTDVNNNPNAPTDVPTELLIRPSITNSAALGLGVGMTWNHAGLWAQHVAQIQYPDEDRYVVRDETMVALWNDWYAVPLKDIQTIIEKAEATSRPNEAAVGLILKSWNYGVMTDLWGDLPYSQALQGEGGNFSARYDSQQDIYNGIFADLRAAAEMINTAGTGFPAANDLLYGGNMARWQKFANSLRLRHAMRLTNVDANRAKLEFEAAMAAQGGVISSNAEEARLNYLATSPNRNPFFENQITRNDHRISHTLVEFMRGRGDPRLRIYANPTEANPDTIIGHLNGLNPGSALLPTRSKVGTWFTSNNSPVFFMRHAEVLFLRAEAAQRGWNAGGTAKALYEQAVTASMQQYNIPAAEITAYLARAENNFDAAANKLQLIGEQKWVALFGQGFEAFAEWRRTGFPHHLEPGPNANNRPNMPRRLPYPNIEESLNRASIQEAIQRQGGANNVTLFGRVWWDRP